MFVGCSETSVSVTVKHVQHIVLIRTFCLPGGTEEIAGLWFAWGISTQADIMPLPGKFPIISEYSHKTFLLESVFVKSGILVCRPVTLEKKVQFFKVFFWNF